MAEDGGGEMQGDTAKKEHEHWCPFYGFDDGPEEYFLTEAVAQHGECKR
jgi:hypothetical protein